MGMIPVLNFSLFLRASFAAVLDPALAAVVAVTARARIALAARLERVVRIRIGESGFALARETSLRVDALGIVTAVVQFRRTAFVQICYTNVNK